MLNTFADLLLPPISLATLAFLLHQSGRRWRRAGIACVGLLLLLGLPAVSGLMLAALDPPAEPAPAEPPQAIVILSGDAFGLSGPDDLDPGWLTLDRLRTGAALQRRTGLPILVTGGPSVPPPSLGAMMARSLRDDFRLETRWTEGEARDTWENAEFSAAILRQDGISRVYLVTHAWHMRRALVAFRRFGLQTTPASVRPDRWPQFRWLDFVPRASAWQSSYYALHETVGLIVYTLRR